MSKLRAAKTERNRIKRKRKAHHVARMEYWARRGRPAMLRAEAKDPDKKALAVLEQANIKLKKRVRKKRPPTSEEIAKRAAKTHVAQLLRRSQSR